MTSNREFRSLISTQEVTDPLEAKDMILRLMRNHGFTPGAITHWVEEAKALPPVVDPDSHLRLEEDRVAEAVRALAEEHLDAGEVSVGNTIKALETQIVHAVMTAPTAGEHDGAVHDVTHLTELSAVLAIVDQFFEGEWHLNDAPEPHRSWSESVHAFGAFNQLQSVMHRHPDAPTVHMFRFDRDLAEITVDFAFPNPNVPTLL